MILIHPILTCTSSSQLNEFWEGMYVQPRDLLGGLLVVFSGTEVQEESEEHCS